jgi:hypothetical protein
MTDRDDALADFDSARADLAATGLRRYLVTVLLRTWSGGAPGAGTATTAGVALIPTPRVRQISAREIASSGGTYEAGDYRIDRITPAYGSVETVITPTVAGAGLFAAGMQIDPANGVAPGSFAVVAQIVAPGAVGVATFRYSTNGGSTWSSAILTAANVLIQPLGLAFQFSGGAFHALDQWAFAAVSGGFVPPQLNPVPASGQDVRVQMVGDNGTRLCGIVGPLKYDRAFGYSIVVRPTRETP